MLCLLGPVAEDGSGVSLPVCNSVMFHPIFSSNTNGILQTQGCFNSMTVTLKRRREVEEERAQMVEEEEQREEQRRANNAEEHRMLDSSTTPDSFKEQ